MLAFGDALRERRRARGMTQRQLAAGAGIETTYLCKAERGTMDPPGEGTIRRLCATLGDDPTELILLAGKVPSDVREIVLSCPEVSQFLRAARAASWGDAEWRGAAWWIEDYRDCRLARGALVPSPGAPDAAEAMRALRDGETPHGD